MKSVKGLVLVTLVYWLIFALMLPLYNKAYLDDFHYIHTVQHLVTEHHFKLSEGISTSFIAQIFWGAGWGFAFSPSPIVLQLSTVVLGWIGVIAFYILLHSLGFSPFAATILSLALLAYPWTILLTYSFMTDVPFLAFLLLALVLYKQKKLFVASLFASLAFLTREVGLALPLATLFVLYRKPRDLILATVLPLVTLGVYLAWLHGHYTFAQYYFIEHAAFPSPYDLGFYVVHVFVPLLPLLLSLIPSLKPSRWSLAILVFLVLLTWRTPLPVASQKVNDYAQSLGLVVQLLKSFLWKPLLIIAMYILSVSMKIWNYKWPVIPWTLIFLVGITLWKPLNFAEYALPFVPFVLILLGRQVDRRRWSAVTATALMLILSFANTKSTYSAEGQIWQAAQKQVDQGADPNSLAVNQFAWAPWWNYDQDFARELARVGGDKRKITQLLFFVHPHGYY